MNCTNAEILWIRSISYLNVCLGISSALGNIYLIWRLFFMAYLDRSTKILLINFSLAVFLTSSSLIFRHFEQIFGPCVFLDDLECGIRDLPNVMGSLVILESNLAIGIERWLIAVRLHSTSKNCGLGICIFLWIFAGLQVFEIILKCFFINFSIILKLFLITF